MAQYLRLELESVRGTKSDRADGIMQMILTNNRQLMPIFVSHMVRAIRYLLRSRSVKLLPNTPQVDSSVLLVQSLEQTVFPQR